MAIHSSILAWEIPWTEEPGELQSTESQRVEHDRRDLACRHAKEKKIKTLLHGHLLVQFREKKLTPVAF